MVATACYTLETQMTTNILLSPYLHGHTSSVCSSYVSTDVYCTHSGKHAATPWIPARSWTTSMIHPPAFFSRMQLGYESELWWKESALLTLCPLTGIAVDGPCKKTNNVNGSSICLIKKTGKVKALDEELYSEYMNIWFVFLLACFPF